MEDQRTGHARLRLKNMGGIMLRSNKHVKGAPVHKPRKHTAGDNALTDPFDHGLARGFSGAHGQNDTQNAARAHYLRGLAQEERGEYIYAIREYDRALSLDPRLAWAYYHRGIAHGSSGNFRQETEDLQAAARLGLRAAADALAACGSAIKKTQGE